MNDNTNSVRDTAQRGYEAAHQIVMKVIRLPRSQWTMAIDESCGNNDGLKSEVRKMLDEVDRENEGDISPGDRIDSYTIRGVLGVGSMGSVYEAVQDNTEQVVAIKVLGRHAFTVTGRQRFVWETRALGKLDHPGIARVFDAQPRISESDPRPYMVMELVRGQMLDEYLRQAKLSLKNKLKLLATICDAVADAHLKGVIHRDLKPSNIVINQSGEPKVVDFGIARLVDEQEDGQLLTQTGTMIGTPAYMSPEQCSGNPLSIDVRTDVYSLGVIGFEMLSDRNPHKLDGKDSLGAMQTIREVPPAKLRSVSRGIPRDVDTIFSKALKTNKVNRYRGADELAEDIRRFLSHRPIEAQPPGSIKRAIKWVRRHPTISATFVTLVAGIVGVSIFAYQTSIARDDSERKAKTASETTFFIQEVLVQADPFQADGKPPTILDAMMTAEIIAGEHLKDQPAVESSIRAMLGRIYFRWGDTARAKRQWELAIDLARKADPPNVAVEIAALQQIPIANMRLANSAGAAPNERNAAALAAVAELEALLPRAKDELGEEDLTTHAIMNTLYSAYMRVGRPEDAEKGFRQLVVFKEKINPSDSLDVLTVKSWIGHAILAQKKYGQAKAVFEEVLSDLTVSGSQSLELWLATRHAVIRILRIGGKHDEARDNLAELLRDAKEVIVSPNHPVITRLQKELDAMNRRQ